MKRNLGVTIEADIVNRLDKERGLVPRSTYLEMVLKERYKIGGG
jgi:hypothetical protein